MYGILAFGDSITFGRGVVPSRGWVHRLKKHFETQDFYNILYNLGVPGDSSSDLLERFETEIKARAQPSSPDDKFLILIAIGTNDSIGLGSSDDIEKPLKDYEKKINKMAKIAKEYTDKIVFLGLPPVDESSMPYRDAYFDNKAIEKFNDTMKDVAEKNDALFCDIYERFTENKDYSQFFVDGLHPNDKGYKLMYKAIKEFLTEKKVI